MLADARLSAFLASARVALGLAHARPHQFFAYGSLPLLLEGVRLPVFHASALFLVVLAQALLHSHTQPLFPCRVTVPLPLCVCLLSHCAACFVAHTCRHTIPLNLHRDSKNAVLARHPSIGLNRKEQKQATDVLFQVTTQNVDFWMQILCISRWNWIVGQIFTPNHSITGRCISASLLPCSSR